jgi:DNA-binding response OmpR family regulator
VDVHISRLRRKLPPLRAVLATVRHLGYRLDVPDTLEAAS